MAAQLAPFVTFELIPYFLKKPFSCAMTIGEQSVSAIMPKLMSGASGASLAFPAVAAHEREPSADHNAAAPTPAAARVRNWRRLQEAASARAEAAAEVTSELRSDFMRLVMWIEALAMEIFAKQAAG